LSVNEVEQTKQDMNKKIIIILTTVVILTILGLGIKMFLDRPSEEGKMIQEIYQAQETASLSPGGEALKAELIKFLGGKAGAIINNSDFEIGYLPAPLERLMIFVNFNNWQEKENTAISWLKSRGFSDADICGFPTVISVVTDTPESSMELPGSHVPSFCSEDI